MNYPELPALVRFFSSSDWLDIYSSEIRTANRSVLLYHGLTQSHSRIKKGCTDSAHLYYDAIKLRLAVDEMVYHRPSNDKPKHRIHEDLDTLKALILLLRRTQDNKPFDGDVVVACVVYKIEGALARLRKA